MKNLGILIILCILSTGCADVTHAEECFNPHVYGFFGGLWHGMITSFSFIGSLFSDDIAIYAVSNNGGWYDFGFMLGLGGAAPTIVKTVNQKRR